MLAEQCEQIPVIDPRESPRVIPAGRFEKFQFAQPPFAPCPQRLVGGRGKHFQGHRHLLARRDEGSQGQHLKPVAARLVVRFTEKYEPRPGQPGTQVGLLQGPALGQIEGDSRLHRIGVDPRQPFFSGADGRAAGQKGKQYGQEQAEI